MAKSFKQPLLIGLLALTPLFAACERAADISGVTEAPVAAAAKPKAAKVVKRAHQAVGGHLVSDWVTAGKTTTLKLGKYELFIPKGAVKKPTTFRMTVLTGSVIGVSLEAFDNHGEPVTQFRVPLHLTLPYDEGDITDLENPGKLVLANIVSADDETILDLTNASADTVTKTVKGNITHFSIWSLARVLTKELSPGID